MRVLNVITRSYFVLALCSLLTASEQDTNNETLQSNAEEQLLPRDATTTLPGLESTTADSSEPPIITTSVGTTETAFSEATSSGDNEGMAAEEKHSTTTAGTTTRSPATASEEHKEIEGVTRVEGMTDVPTQSSGLASADVRRRKQMALEECICGPQLDPVKCLGGRTTTPPVSWGCQCHALVCARQAGEPCSDSSPCDAEFGLRCNSQNATCQGPLSIEVTEVTSHSARIRWSSGESELQHQALVFYSSAYRGQHATQWTKINGAKPFVEIENLLPSQIYFVKVEEDGKQEITTFHTKDNVFGNMPKILVKQRSQNTLTVVWDDFRLPSYHSEYILEYRASADDSRNWTKVQAGTQTIVSLSNLRPNTPYDLKVAVWEDDKLELPSEVITAFTADGCVAANQSYSVGEGLPSLGCDARCVCRGSNETSCGPRCTLPSFRAGEGGRRADPLCYEKPLPSDPCCATLLCTESKFYGDSAESKNKSGECPEIVEELESDSKSCLSDCDHDGDCSGNLKCCPSSCGGAVCVLPEDVCEHIYCGPNAECVSKKKACECSKGYHGDPHDFLTGCVLVNSPNSSTPDSQNGTPQTDSGTRESHEMKHVDTGKASDSKSELENRESSTKDPPSTEAPFRLDLTSHSNQTAEDTAEMPSDEENFHLRRPQDPVANQSSMSVADFPALFDGCEFNNVTYDRGVMFADGCEARCTCQGQGHISCVPRCRTPGPGGSPGCSEQQDPDDPCCRIIVCSFPTAKMNVTILSALAQSGTRIRVRVELSKRVPGGRDHLEVWWGTSAAPPKWERKLLLHQLTEVGEGKFEFDLQDLASNTEYFLRLYLNSSTSEFSNTVNVKTFPAGVMGVQEVCVRHNRSYALGEAFFEGCEHRCVCREEGLVECQDRCEVYVDTVGYEGCDWVPSEEDPCCTIPMCRRKIPLLPGVPFTGAAENICVVEGGSGERYSVGDIWESGDGCKTKICRCTLQSNGSTSIQCTSECPPLAPNAHVPTARCPHPVLVKPDGSCACPYVLCNDVPRRPPAQEAPRCEFKSRWYAAGEEFHDGCVATCHCGRDLHVSCAAIECPYHFSSEYSSCLEWDIDPHFFPTPPHCCAPAKCINDGSCAFSGKRFANFESIPGELLPCGSRCVCVNGNVTCENRCPFVEDAPPSSLPCPSALAFRGSGEEDCCTRWLCPPQQLAAPACMFQGVRRLSSERWESGQKSCSCLLGEEGPPRVECGCPSVPHRFLLPTEQCPRPVTVTPEDPLMCPYVVCNNTVSGQELHSVKVVALNSTAVRVRFSLSSLLVGLAGHAELHFTTDPALPHSQWHVQKFSRPKRLFDSPNIEYVLNALRPNTTYFLRVKIRVDALQGGPESELFKLVMPEDPASPPPTVTLDARAEAHVVDPQTVRVSWRSFDPSEKRFLYALQLQYRLKREGVAWTTTPMIHRDVTSYFLHGLRPASEYLLQLLFTPPKDARTKVVSTQNLEFRTAGELKSEYHLQVSVDHVEDGKTSFSVTGIPEPIAKYVHVIKILYKSNADGEQLYSFKVPKTTRVLLEDLKPGRKYLAQLELYLTNGQTLTSNEVEFNTKQAGNISSSQNVKLQELRSNGKPAELLQSDSVGAEQRAYFIALVVVAVVAAVAAFGFVLLLVLLVRRQASAKAPISRTPSESAYDNPTYKTYDGERPEDKTNGQVIQTTQA